MSLIIENQYFANIDLVKKSINSTDIIIEQCENFQKSSFRNRCIILAANGLQTLTVPIKGGREQKTPIRELQIDYSQSWQKEHWKGINSAYRNSSFFEYYEKSVYDLIYSNEVFLWDLNIGIFKWIFKVMRVDVAIKFTDAFEKEYDTGTDSRNQILPKNFQLGLDDWQPKYFQVFMDRHGFQPNLSILDLIFNEGPNAKNLLTN